MIASVLRRGAAVALGTVLLAGCDVTCSQLEDDPVMARGTTEAKRMLDAMRWRNRILVVASEAPDEMIDRQLADIAVQATGWSDRDLVTILAFRDRGFLVEDASGGMAAAEPLGAGVADAIRSRFDLAGEGFEAVLVGKDGGVKARYAAVVAPEGIFPFIDAMPMRIDEMEAER